MHCKTTSTKPVFKAYHLRQAMLHPPGLDKLIATKHPVRIIEEMLGKINIQPLISCYASVAQRATILHVKKDICIH